jgi:hypothetical protein
MLTLALVVNGEIDFRLYVFACFSHCGLLPKGSGAGGVGGCRRETLISRGLNAPVTRFVTIKIRHGRAGKDTTPKI